MVKEELYYKSVQILYDAYFNDTLEHGDCCGCAVGNLVAGNMGIRVKRDTPYSVGWFDEEGKMLPYPAFGDSPDDIQGWAAAVCSNSGVQDIYPQNLIGSALDQINATGYSFYEICRIEKAFESADRRLKQENRMFEGLVKVLDALRDIHQVTDEDLIQGNNKRFKDHYNRKVSQVEG